MASELTNFLDKNGTTLQNMALLAFLRGGEEARPLLTAATGAQVALDLYRRLTAPEAAMEQARLETTLAIAQWVKQHPRARPHEVQKKVEEEVEIFKAKIQKL